MYPNGQSWFLTFILYVTLYHDLNRSTSLLTQTWEAFDDIVPFRGTLEASPMRDPTLRKEDLYVLSFDFKFAKGENKEVTIPQRYLGRLNEESLVESPNQVMYLNLHLLQLFGIGLLQLKAEKAADSPLWNEIKCTYMFPGSLDSPTYTAELGNKHLRLVLEFLGFAPRIVETSVCHSSFRGGGAAGAEANVRKGEYCEDADQFVILSLRYVSGGTL